MSRKIALLFLAAVLVVVPALTGCGGGETEQSAAETQAEPAATVATHDCDGACGMTSVPEDQLTEVDGKWYCAGCAPKDETTDEHAGHDHG